jgi:hypothetical protein
MGVCRLARKNGLGVVQCRFAFALLRLEVAYARRQESRGMWLRVAIICFHYSLYPYIG